MLQVIFKALRKLQWWLYKFLSYTYPSLLAPRGITFGSGLSLYGLPSISVVPTSSIKLGSNIVLCSDSNFTALPLSHTVRIHTIRAQASITIGNNTGVSGATIISAASCSIGKECLIGVDATIIDTDFHAINPIGRRFNDNFDQIKSQPIVIGDNCFIGTIAIILKGTIIGSDSVVAAGAVVVSNQYPNGAILAGNPAKVVGFTK
jgi:acetyltransferase-like isoleucine patch superfamily enzyme